MRRGIAHFIERALKNEPIVIFGDGEQTRDFIGVKDVVAANVFFAMQSSETGIFNVASGRGITIHDLAKTICRLTGSYSKIEYADERPGDVRHSLASIEKSSAAGFKPAGNFSNDLKETILKRT